jgi:hypothetical protein
LVPSHLLLSFLFFIDICNLGLIIRVIPVPVLDAWGFGEVEQKLRSEAKLARMRERHQSGKKKGNPDAFERFEDEV